MDFVLLQSLRELFPFFFWVREGEGGGWMNAGEKKETKPGKNKKQKIEQKDRYCCPEL
jgi:hypothetical protein